MGEKTYTDAIDNTGTVAMRGILEDVAEERVWQNRHWGAAHDQNHDLEEWLVLIDQRMDKLHGDVVITPLRRRFLLIKVAALAAAAIEALEDY